MCLFNQFHKELDEEMTVSLDLDDGTTVVCSIVTIFEMNDKDYIALMPLDEEGNAEENNVKNLNNINAFYCVNKLSILFSNLLNVILALLLIIGLSIAPI